MPILPENEILAAAGEPPPGLSLGFSREGREILGYRFGSGPRTVSLIAGCHADEPVGPVLLRRLVRYLDRLEEGSETLQRWSWAVVPDTNPDGAERNESWSRALRVGPESGSPDLELERYLLEAVREGPGEDVEFGFPRSAEDLETRPENLAVARFLDESAPIAVHASLHGMGFATGPWFLLDAAWRERSEPLRRRLAARVRQMGYRLHEVDRGGEKGFWRIDTGFSTRPDSRAMAAHFLQQGDPEMAGRFRPSSMEYVRRGDNDALTLVTEMPLFLLPEGFGTRPGDPPDPTGTEGRLAFLAWTRALRQNGDAESFRSETRRIGIVPMPLEDQMRLQLAFVEEGLATQPDRESEIEA